MKKLIVGMLAGILVLGTMAVAQDTTAKPDDKMAASAPLKTLAGTVKADGDKFTFVNDEDSKSWDVMNPETLKGHDGHHVQLSAHVYADKNSIHVMKVKMLKADATKK